jgi:hypothetical protein
MKTSEDLLRIVHDLAAQVQETRDRGHAGFVNEEALVRRLLTYEELDPVEREAIIYAVRQKMGGLDTRKWERSVGGRPRSP